MRIKRVDLSFAAEKGLRSKTMESLGQVVVLAGPNGAGKSRLLRAIREHLSHTWRQPNELERLASQVQELERQDFLGRPTVQLDSTGATWKTFLDAAKCIEVDGEFKIGQVFDFLPKNPVRQTHRDRYGSPPIACRYWRPFPRRAFGT